MTVARGKAPSRPGGICFPSRSMARPSLPRAPPSPHLSGYGSHIRSPPAMTPNITAITALVNDDGKGLELQLAY